MNPYLEDMVDDLLKLLKDVQFQTPSCNLSSRIVRAALAYISSDLPATRKVCGFYGIKAKYGCSECLKSFQNPISSNNDYSGFKREEWKSRTLADHIVHVNQAKKATSQAARERCESAR